MALVVEGVVDGPVEGKETLRRPSRFEALHLPFSSTDDLMRILRPVVGSEAAFVTRSQPRCGKAAAYDPSFSVTITAGVKRWLFSSLGISLTAALRARRRWTRMSRISPS